MPICLTRQLYVEGRYLQGRVLVQRHTSSPDANPLFGGPSRSAWRFRHLHRHGAVMDGTGSVGKASQIFKATLRKLAELE